MQEKKLLAQIAAFKSLSVGDDRWRLAFYNIANEFWNMKEHFVILDKESYKQGWVLPIIIEHKGTLAMQFFTSYNKAKLFLEKNVELKLENGDNTIYKLNQGAFQQVFVPFLAKQNISYVINEGEDHFLDTCERLLAVMEADTDYIVDEEQLKLVEAGDLKGFYADACKKYLVKVND